VPVSDILIFMKLLEIAIYIESIYGSITFLAANYSHYIQQLALDAARRRRRRMWLTCLGRQLAASKHAQWQCGSVQNCIVLGTCAACSRCARAQQALTHLSLGFH
jgi:hypothetical protein